MNTDIEVVREYMARTRPNQKYNIAQGNACIWVYWGSYCPINMYFIVRDGVVVDVQID